MIPGDIVLVSMPMRNGKRKKRPALILQKMRPFGDFLVCGVSSQVKHEVPGFDLKLTVDDDNFPHTGLKASSIVRLGYLTTVSTTLIPGKIGQVTPEQLEILIDRLINYLNERE